MHEMKTYLYVDGENFATRARKLDEELKKDSVQREDLKEHVDRWHAKQFGMALDDYSDWNEAAHLWAPRPHRHAFYDTRMQSGLLYSKDEIYWDSVGMYFSLNSSLATLHLDESRDVISVHRAYYYTGALGTRIEQHTRDLHAMGFVPNVLPRVKPDSFVQQMAAQGITVISRPKPMDILVATQVLDDCAAGNFDRCIFVGGDEDYVPLLDAVRRRGKQVWLVAFERWLGKDQKLRLACDRFIAYDPVLSVRPLPDLRPEESP